MISSYRAADFWQKDCVPMSRLDSFIRRLQAQRACLNAAVGQLQDQPGPVLEIGLGNGRTYDHLREICGDRRIYVFDRQVAAHPDCIPPKEDLFLGDFGETLPRAAAQLGTGAALLHLDCGTGDAEANRQLVESMMESLLRLTWPGSILVSDQEISHDNFDALPLPAEVKPGRYHMLRRQ
jgi:hypothetical protein